MDINTLPTHDYFQCVVFLMLELHKEDLAGNNDSSTADEIRNHLDFYTGGLSGGQRAIYTKLCESLARDAETIQSTSPTREHTVPTTTIATATTFIMHPVGVDVSSDQSIEVEVCDFNGGFFHIKNLGNSAGLEVQLNELEELLHHCKAFAAQYTANTGVSFSIPEGSN